VPKFLSKKENEILKKFFELISLKVDENSEAYLLSLDIKKSFA
jgi:hypothetical protein